MRVLGVDPGLRVTGYAVIACADRPTDSSVELVEAGVIRTREKSGIAERLAEIYRSLGEVVSELAPDVMVIEKLYAHYKHPATAILMGHARGTVCLLSGERKLPLTSIASTHVKKAVTGKGHASKWQVQKMVQQNLGLKSVPEPPDVADAMAIALAYAFNRRKPTL